MKNLIKIVVIFFLFNNIVHSQTQGQKLLGVQLNGVTSGLNIGFRGWIYYVGYSVSGGMDWSFNDFNAEGKIMFSPNLKSNKYYIVVRAGYYNFNDSGSLLNVNYSYSGELFTFGLGVGYEWFLNSHNSFSIDGGYNIKSKMNYNIYINGVSFSMEYKIPYWVGGSYTFYF